MGNSRDLPKYERSVATEVVAQPNMQDAGAILINSFRQFSNLATDVATNYNRQDAQNEKELIKNNISNAYKSFSLDALKVPDQNKGLDDYNEKHQQYSKGMIAQANPFNKAYVTNLTDYYYNQHIMQVERNAIQQNKRLETVNFTEYFNNAVIDMKNNISNAVHTIDEHGNDVTYNAATALFTMTMKNLKDYAANRDPAFFKTASKELTNVFYTDIYVNKFQHELEAGRGHEYIAKFLNPKTQIPGLDIIDKSKIAGQMIKLEGQMRTATNLRDAAFNKLADDDVVRVTNGGMPSAQLSADVHKYAPEKAIQHEAKIDIAQGIYAGTQAVRYMTPKQTSEFIESSKPKDPNAPNYPHELEKWEKTSAAINLQFKEFKENPMKQTLEDPTIQAAVNHYEQAFNVGAVGSTKLYSPVNNIVPMPWDSVIKFQMEKGLTLNGSNGNRVKVIENSQVSQRVNAIVAATPFEKLKQINRLSEEFGGGLAFNLAIKQLIDGGMPKNYAFMANIDPNSPDAHAIAEAFSLPTTALFEEVRKKDPTALKDINNKSMSDVFGFTESTTLFGLMRGENGGTPAFASFMNTTTKFSGEYDSEYRNQIATAVQTIASHYVLTKNMSTDDAITKAEDIIGKRYNYTALDNTEIRYPKNVSEQNIKNYSKKMEAVVNTFPWNLGGYDKQYAKQLISQGHWKNDSVDHGLVWVDGNGKMWTDKNGHPLSFSFNEATTGIADHGSDNRIAEADVAISNPDTDLAKDPDLQEIDKKGDELLASTKKRTYRSLINQGNK